MGNCSCKEKKKKTAPKTAQKSVKPDSTFIQNTVEAPKITNNVVKNEEKKVTLKKNRIVPQKGDSLYKVIFDPEGFSVHDLGLIGQAHDEICLFDKKLKPIARGAVEIPKDVVRLFNRPPKKPEKTSKSSRNDKKSFQIVEINDYLDDLYIQLMEPDKPTTPA